MNFASFFSGMRARIAKGLIARKTKKPRKCDTLELPLEGAA